MWLASAHNADQRQLPCPLSSGLAGWYVSGCMAALAEKVMFLFGLQISSSCFPLLQATFQTQSTLEVAILKAMPELPGVGLGNITPKVPHVWKDNLPDPQQLVSSFRQEEEGRKKCKQGWRGGTSLISTFRGSRPHRHCLGCSPFHKHS